MAGFGTDGKDTSGSSSGGGGGQTNVEDRGNLYVKAEYGTKLFGPRTECEFCDGLAAGVLRVTKDGMIRMFPVCDEKREELEDRMDMEFRDHVFVEWDA